MSQQPKWVYSDKLKEHFTNPHNILGEHEDPDTYDGKGKVGNVGCGDEMLLVIKVDKQKKIITDCKWRTYGCASAIASTSILSEITKGKTLKQAYAISPQDIIKELGGLPEHKIHCSVLGDKALRAAINDYYLRQGIVNEIAEKETHVVCKCMNITDREIEQVVLDGAKTYRTSRKN